jgi:hypothetical protein
MRKKYKLFSLSGFLITVLGAGAVIAAHDANAQRIELDPPPLIWQERPAKKEIDNTEYWKQKYGLKSRAQLEAQRKAAEEAQKNNEAQAPQTIPAQRIGNAENPKDQPTVAGSGRLNASDEQNASGVFLDSEARMRARKEAGEIIGSPDSSGDNPAESDIAEPRQGDQPLDTDRSDNATPDGTTKPPCNFSEFVGKNIASVNMKQFGRRPVRVLYPNQKVTQDYSMSRINFEVNRSGKILDVGCY